MAEKGPRLEQEAAESTMALQPLIGLAQEDLAGAVGVLLRETAMDPGRTFKHMQLMSDDVVKILTNNSDIAPDPRDKRFADAAWRDNPFFKAGVQYYLAMERGTRRWLDDLELDDLERDRARFVSGIIVDALSPANSLLGNPAAQKRAIETGGGSLMRGLKNAYRDMVHNDGIVSQVDKRPFKIGENIATSKGSVIFRNEMMEVIQYQPTTEQVHAIPNLTIPPQINKVYINDLSPEKSVVKWQLDNGIQTFLISWRNPGPKQGHWGMSDYVACCIEAIGVVAEATGSDKVNLSGACSGGQTMSTTLSKLADSGDKRVGAVTMMVCVLEPKRGDTEASALISDNGIALARQRAAKDGVVDGANLARGFAWLRPNDLIWNYVINNYLLGEDPPAFDVLFWNADATNLSNALLRDFLDIFAADAFAKPGTLAIADHKIDLTKVTNDLFILGGVTDHITPWRACYRSTQLFGSKNVEFVLSQSGHMQAILNPPGNPKARFYKAKTRKHPPAEVDQWLAGAEEVEGSWWPYWMEWLQKRSGPKKVAPDTVGSKAHPPSDPAPGTYVFDDA